MEKANKELMIMLINEWLNESEEGKKISEYDEMAVYELIGKMRQ
ncbi:MAG: hypothetical protein WC666_03795 [Candidatus Paceibacterota bacterium]|jgi:hypothetical protein